LGAGASGQAGAHSDPENNDDGPASRQVQATNLGHDETRMSVHPAAAILAGGRARRFGGRDKSRLPVEGRPIINRQLDVLQQMTAEIFVVAADAARFADLGVPVYADAVPGAGELGGIYTALERARAGRVIVVACDLPFLHEGLLSRLAELAADHDAAWVQTERGPEPLLACYRRACRERIARRIAAGQLKASDLGAELEVAALGPADVEAFGPVARLLANVNTPEDYERLRRCGSLQSDDSPHP
jgi:molybdopterin-guanine dinucleotide biosynthesis protein A